MAHFRILVVEDYPETRELITEVLLSNSEYEVIPSASGEEALKTFKENKIDLVVTDIKMQKMSGLDLMNEIHIIEPDFPIILVTGFGDEYGVKALEMGAEDCVFKPFDTHELLLRVSRVLKYSKLKQLKELLELKNEELRKMAITDGLSQLYNRRFLLELLEDREFPRAQRYSLKLSCIMLDIDHFKEVNDKYGHLQGDYVIQRLGGIIKDEIREIDVPARYGGEEFIILLPETDEKGTVKVAERLRKQTESTNLIRNEKLRETQNLNITISLGISVYPHKDIHNASDLIRLSDEALYEAKRAGRNCSRVARASA
jgi:diguanylate cyclase (GGDEF)-like protein